MPRVAVVGGGPAGLMAAEVLSSAGHEVHLFDRMPSVGRKFLLAGRGGLNLTHAEPRDTFIERFGPKAGDVADVLGAFGGPEVRAWAKGLGIDTFVGTSGRVFPVDMKSAPLLRAWLHRLRHPMSGRAVQFHQRHVWRGWNDDGELRFDTPHGAQSFAAQATVLALGGASWPRLGSDGSWVDVLTRSGVAVAPLRPSNCGFDVSGGWTEHFMHRAAGQPLKSISFQVLSPANDVVDDPTGRSEKNHVLFSRKGECVVTETGLEGSVVYAASRLIREQVDTHGKAEVRLDLLPDWSTERVAAAVTAPRGSRSLSSHLKGRLTLDGVKLGLLYEQLGADRMHNPQLLSEAIKSLPVTLVRPRPLGEAISTAGGVCFDALDKGCMLTALAGVFCAGEMLDWEAPTGGYLLTACLAQGHWVGRAVCAYLGPAGQRVG